ncbi:Putative structural protein [Propionibacterium phage B5]|uniref:Orf4 n=1 Tax=Propionibacterium phage B5 TaxID=189836 RepID=Q8SCI2_9VIRU|nr:Putative structural protein [Propionibacterium phage B5]AAL91697.1 Orf4 [Propionibacterium phage B5]
MDVATACLVLIAFLVGGVLIGFLDSVF